MNTSKQKLLNQFMRSLTSIRRIAERSFCAYKKGNLITLLQNQALLHLKDQPESTVGNLAEKLGLSSSSVAQLIERLTNLKLITKKTDKDDRRINHLNLTEKGQDQIEITHNVLVEKVGKVFSQMPERDLKKVVLIFNNFLKKIEK